MQPQPQKLILTRPDGPLFNGVTVECDECRPQDRVILTIADDRKAYCSHTSPDFPYGIRRGHRLGSISGDRHEIERLAKWTGHDEDATSGFIVEAAINEIVEHRTMCTRGTRLGDFLATLHLSESEWRLPAVDVAIDRLRIAADHHCKPPLGNPTREQAVEALRQITERINRFAASPIIRGRMGIGATVTDMVTIIDEISTIAGEAVSR